MGTIQTTEAERARVKNANATFDTYAGTGPDEDISMMPVLQTLQVEHTRWQAAQFNGPQPLIVMVAGISEEACWELPVAVEADNRDEVYDSIGDILIYTCAACTTLRLDFSTIAQDFDPSLIQMPDGDGFAGWMNLFKAVGMASHVVGKEAQKTRGYDDIAKVREDCGVALSRVCAAVHWLAFNNDWDAGVLFQDVLHRVMKRDWTKNKLTGDVVSETADAP